MSCLWLASPGQRRATGSPVDTTELLPSSGNPGQSCVATELTKPLLVTGIIAAFVNGCLQRQRITDCLHSSYSLWPCWICALDYAGSLLAVINGSLNTTLDVHLPSLIGRKEKHSSTFIRGSLSNIARQLLALVKQALDTHAARMFLHDSRTIWQEHRASVPIADHLVSTSRRTVMVEFCEHCH